MAVLTRINRISLADIPGQLRKLADDIEAGVDASQEIYVILKYPDGPPAVCAWGKFESYDAMVGTLFKAAVEMASMTAPGRA